jgi:hypothetical protein
MPAAITYLNETLDSIERRKYEDAEIARIQQAISNDAYTRQQEEQKQKDLMAGMEAYSAATDAGDLNPLPSQPLPGTQAPPPAGAFPATATPAGQSSQPAPKPAGGPPPPGAMPMPPGGMPPPQGAPARPSMAMPPPAAQGAGAPQGAAPPPGAPAPPAAPPGAQIAAPQPQGWQVGKTAPPTLGGGISAQVPPPPTASDGTPLAPPPPPQVYQDPMAVYKWARKQGYSPEVSIQAMKASMAMVDAHNKELLNVAQRENYAQMAAEHAAKAAKSKWDEEHPKEGAKTTLTKEAERLQELQEQGKGNTTEAKALKAHIARMDKMPGSAGGGEAKPTGDAGKTGDDYLKTIPAADRPLVKGISEGRINPTTLSTKGGHREHIMSEVMQYNPGYDQQEYGVTGKTEKDFATGKQGNSVRAFNVALEHLDTLGKLGDALNNNDTQGINKVANAWKTQTGDPGPTNFNGAKQLVADEVVKAIVGSGGGVSDREEAAKTIQAASSPAQLKGVIDTYKKLFDGQLKGLAQQYKAGTGKDDFEKRYLTSRGRGEAEAAPTKNAKGWTLHTDKNGNKAYVSPDGKQYEEVK